MPGSHSFRFIRSQVLFETVVQFCTGHAKRKLLSARQLMPRAWIRRWNPFDFRRAMARTKTTCAAGSPKAGRRRRNNEGASGASIIRKMVARVEEELTASL